jgi:hypothetical protein
VKPFIVFVAQCKRAFQNVWKLDCLYLGLLIIVYGFFLLHRIDISGGDLGRHLMNGKVFVDSILSHQSVAPLLHSNFYSALFAETPFINHHWGSGVLFFLVWKVAGYFGLILFFAFISVATVCFFWFVIPAKSRTLSAFVFGLVMLALVTERVEIRPEAFSYLFAGVFFFILEKQRRGEVSKRLLYLLPVLQVAWVNLHIYFFLGPLLVGLYFLESFLLKPAVPHRATLFAKVFVATIIAGCINPSGVAGLLYPLTILSNYGFSIQENVPLAVLGSEHPWYGPIIVFKLVALFLSSTATILFIKRRANFPTVHTVLFAAFAALTWHMARNIALFGFFALPVCVEFWNQVRTLQVAGQALYLEFNQLYLFCLTVNFNIKIFYRSTKRACFLSELFCLLLVGIYLRLQVVRLASQLRRRECTCPWRNSRKN